MSTLTINYNFDEAFVFLVCGVYYSASVSSFVSFLNSEDGKGLFL